MSAPRTVVEIDLRVEHAGYGMWLSNPEGLLVVRFQSLRSLLHFLPFFRRVRRRLPSGVPFQIALRRIRIPFQLTT